MKHLFLPYKLALSAKQKGFDEFCLAWYFEDNKTKQFILSDDWGVKKSDLKKSSIIAPLYQQIIDWFLTTHDIFIEVLVFDRGWLVKNEFCFQWRIYNKSEEWFTNTVEYKTPTKAYNTAIEEAFKLI